MTKDHTFEYESYQDAESMARYLKALMDGFKNRRIVFTSDDNEIVLQPDDLLRFEVRASNREDKSKITLRFSWKNTRSAKSGSMNIDS